MKLSPQATARLARADNWSLRLITGGSLIVALIAIALTVARVISIASDPKVEVTGMHLDYPNTPAFTAASPDIVSAAYESVTIIARDLSTTARGFLVAEALASGLLVAGLSIVVAVLGIALLKKRPFVRSATASLLSAAVIALVCGASAQFLGGIARAEVVFSLGAEQLMGGSAGGPATEGFPLLFIPIDFSPFGWGLALAVVAGAFQIGERLQRETDGLV